MSLDDKYSITTLKHLRDTLKEAHESGYVARIPPGTNGIGTPSRSRRDLPDGRDVHLRARPGALAEGQGAVKQYSTPELTTFGSMHPELTTAKNPHELYATLSDFDATMATHDIQVLVELVEFHIEAARRTVLLTPDEERERCNRLLALEHAKHWLLGLRPESQEEAMCGCCHGLVSARPQGGFCPTCGKNGPS
jgi:hypothetical protein